MSTKKEVEEYQEHYELIASEDKVSHSLSPKLI